MPAVEQMDIGIRQIGRGRFRTCRTENLVAATPYRQQRHTGDAEILVQPRVQRRVCCIVPEQGELHRVITRP